MLQVSGRIAIEAGQGTHMSCAPCITHYTHAHTRTRNAGPFRTQTNVQAIAKWTTHRGCCLRRKSRGTRPAPQHSQHGPQVDSNNHGRPRLRCACQHACWHTCLSVWHTECLMASLHSCSRAFVHPLVHPCIHTCTLTQFKQEVMCTKMSATVIAMGTPSSLQNRFALQPQPHLVWMTQASRFPKKIRKDSTTHMVATTEEPTKKTKDCTSTWTGTGMTMKGIVFRSAVSLPPMPTHGMRASIFGSVASANPNPNAVDTCECDTCDKCNKCDECDECGECDGLCFLQTWRPRLP